MSLLYSSDHPMVPLTQYDPMVPPYIPSVTVMPQAAHLLPMVSSAVANEAALKATFSASRMYCYNMLVDQYWRNANFAEVVKLTLDLLYLKYSIKKIYSNMETGISECAKEILTLYTSNLVFQYPELKSISTPQVLDAAAQNVPAFNNIKQEIISMYNNNPNNNGFHGGNPGYPVANVPQQQFYPVSQPAFNPNQPQFQQPPFQQPQFQQPQFQQPQFQQPQFQQPGYPPQFQQPGYPQQGSAFPQQHERAFGGNQQISQAQTNTGIGNTGNVNIKQDRFFRPTQTPVAPVPQALAAPVVAKAPTSSALALNYLTIEGGTEVDRSKHQITFFDNKYTMDNAARSARYVESASQLAEAVIEKPEDGGEPSQFFHPEWLMGNSVEDLMTAGKLKQLERKKISDPLQVFRCFGISVKTIACEEQVSDYMKALASATNFTSLAIKLKALVSSLAIKRNDTNYSDNVVSFLSNIDHVLTDIVNDFLSDKLNTPVLIESFADDVSDLESHLTKKYNRLYGSAMARFETEVIDILFNKIDQSSQDAYAAQLEIPAEHFGILPLAYSLTFLSMNDKELGYKVGKEPVIIDGNTAPTLLKLVKSLTRHKKEMDMSTMYDLLVTTDGRVYHVHRNYVLDEQYTIARA